MGILLGSYFHLPTSWALAGIMAGSGVMVIFLSGERKKVGLFLSPLIFVLLGILFIGRVFYPDFPPNHLIHYAGEMKLNIEGLLYRPPDPLEEKVRLYLRAERVYSGEGSFPVTGNILLTLKDRNCNLCYGDRVRFISRLYLPRPATNPGGFDYRRFLALQGIWVTAYANSAAEVVRMEEGRGNPFFHFVEKGREKIRVFLDENAPLERRGIIKALILGGEGIFPRK